jgi:predicted protein tyrosine phosphatase
MRLIVGPARRLAERPDLWRGADLIVLASPGAEVPDLATDGRRLDLRFHDIAELRPGLHAPDAAMIGQLLAFAAEARELAIACYAGVSRSTAAAYAVACQAEALRRRSPAATPNPLVVALADAALARNGRMARAIANIGRGAEAFEGALFVWEPGVHAAED